MNIQRYTWDDAVIEAEAVGVLTIGEARLAHALARQIMWDADIAELRWANELAADVAGISRASYYRNIKGLKAKGFIGTKDGNLMPTYPESQNETHMLYLERQAKLTEAYNLKKSQDETSKYQDETPKSQVDNPYSEDTYTDDLFSEETDAPVVADAPTSPSFLKDEVEDTYSSPKNKLEDSLTSSEKPQKSQDETEAGRKALLIMGHRAKQEFMEMAESNGATEEQIYAAAAIVNSQDGWGWVEKCENALTAVGVPVVIFG